MKWWIKLLLAFVCFYLFAKLSYFATDFWAFLWIFIWAIPVAGIFFVWSAIKEGNR